MSKEKLRGKTVVEDLMEGVDPVGKQIKIDNISIMSESSSASILPEKLRG